MLANLRDRFLAPGFVQIEMKASGLSGEKGVDKHFLEKAKDAEKPVRELETLEAQMEVLAGRAPELAASVRSLPMFFVAL